MRPVVKTVCKTDAAGNRHVYKPYGSAKADLVSNLGDFCSYCDWQANTVALEVEHIKDKHTHPALEVEWDNFLLACKNCNTIKGTEAIDFDTMVFPHLHNTYGLIKYLDEGLVAVNDTHDDDIQQRVRETIRLIGLDRDPSHPDYSEKDKRWEYRQTVWRLANEYLRNYRAGDIQLKTIVHLALARGFWSVWMQVFKGERVVEEALINSFEGTFANCRTTGFDRH